MLDQQKLNFLLDTVCEGLTAKCQESIQLQFLSGESISHIGRKNA